MGAGPSTPEPSSEDESNSLTTTTTPEAETTRMPDNASNECLLCGVAFNFFKRRHHCRYCQKLVCSACSSKTWQFDSGVSGRGAFGHRAGPQRVCNDCYSILVDTQEQVFIGEDADSLESGKFMHFKVVVHEIVGKMIEMAHSETPPQDLEDSSDKDSVSSDTGSFNVFCGPTSTKDPPREKPTKLPGPDVLSLARAPHCRLTVASIEVPISLFQTNYSVEEFLRVGKTSPVEAAQGGDAAAERRNFNETFFFRVWCGSRIADYLIIEVFDEGTLLGHCRVPLFRAPRDRECVFWHELLKVDGVPGAVGRVRITVRNLGAGSIRRPAWDQDISGGCKVITPTDLTPPPDNPLLKEFFPRDSEMHDALFFQFGEKDEEFLPFNERTLVILPGVRMCRLMHHTSGDAVDPSTNNDGYEGGFDTDDSNTSRARVDSRYSVESPVLDTLVLKRHEGVTPLAPIGASASTSRAGSRGGISGGVSPSSTGWPDSLDISGSLRGEGRSRGFPHRSAASMVVNGALMLTTHRVLFVGEAKGEEERTLVEIPPAFIVKTRVKHGLRKGVIGLQIDCRDQKRISFVIRRRNKETWVTVLQSVRRFEEEIEWLAREDNFAHSSDTRRVNVSLDKEGASLALYPDVNSCLEIDPLDINSECTRGFPSKYNPANEHVRQGIDKGKEWRQSRINRNFAQCSTYGRHLVVPSAFEQEDLEKAFEGRSRRRIPVLTWLHPRTRAALCRSSQPMVGLNPNQSLLDVDNRLLEKIKNTAKSSLVSPSRAHSRSTSVSVTPVSVANEPWSMRGKAHLSDRTESSHERMDASLADVANGDDASERASERADIRGVPSAEAGQENDLSQEKPIIPEGLSETLEEKLESRLESSVGSIGTSTRGGGGNLPVTSCVENSEGHSEAGLAGDLVEECEAEGNQISNPFPVKDEGSATADDSTWLAQNSIERGSTCSRDEAREKQSPRMVLLAASTRAEAEAMLPVLKKELDAVVKEEMEGELEGVLEEADSGIIDARSPLPSSLVSSTSSVQGSGSPHSMRDTIVLRVPAVGSEAAAAGANAPPRLSSGPAFPSTGGLTNISLTIVESGVTTANSSRHAWNRAHSESNMTRRPTVLRILDGRSMFSAKLHQIFMGKGHEDIRRLSQDQVASLAFLDIPSKGLVQKSFAALVAACCAQEDDPAWLLHLHNSRWLEYISVVLKGGSIICSHLEAGNPVLVHCSDGWDRTPQLTALAQLMLDPYYRTISGFKVLVEKDWCGFGHLFATRSGHGNDPESRTAPIFPQFLDATYQLLRQFPTSFEFSENLLLLLIHAYYSRWFNNFLHDNEHERVLAYARSRLSTSSGGDSTVSVWAHVDRCRKRYENVLWSTDYFDLGSDLSKGAGTRSPRADRQLFPPPLWPAYGVRSLVFWEGAWAGRGLQHPGCDGSTMEEALRNLAQRR